MHVHPKHLPADECRAASTEALVALASNQNPGDITNTAIAAPTDLPRGAFFRYFPSKDALFQAVVSRVEKRLLARIDRAAESTASPLAALAAMFMTHIDFVSEYPGAPRMLSGELQRVGETLPKRLVQALTCQYNERLQRLLDAGKKLGEVDAQLDVQAAAVLYLATIQGLVTQSLLASDMASIQRTAPGVFAIYQRSISATRISE
ncbi:TetR family transcriptional regulator [Pusillimonas sp. TS35]|uniref:TetR/AcrR family transcriptional regulator n=1 Tax=Paracandidimonas lactea TaxID=2895524 RepID=UPI0013699750|nr:TetR/AcrR family transcriptional regulator [Paracandidimonas lactea]MYN14221.1 TetR family transcriptional regulator [Pusillimonas sp. TS35]